MLELWCGVKFRFPHISMKVQRHILSTWTFRVPIFAKGSNKEQVTHQSSAAIDDYTDQRPDC
jgi:hypothetical protein